MRFNISFNRKFEAVMNDKLISAVEALASVSACAGIRKNSNAAKKARVNHHGAFSTKVPARRFVYDATRNVGDVNFSAALRKIIVDQIQAPVAGYNKRVGKTDYVYGDRTRIHARAKPFGAGGEYGIQKTPGRIMNRIANQMAVNQRNAIKQRAYSGAASNGNDPTHNAPSVAKRKGFDWPMVDTGETYSAIESWTE